VTGDLRYEKPPRGSVTITEHPNASGRLVHTAICSRCGWNYTNSVVTDVREHKRNHSCRVQD
jgi:hypothetical protein